MPTQPEPLFSGAPINTSPEIFEQARRNNPVEYQIFEEAYAQFAALPENAGLYADPKGDGATIQQMWLVFTLFRVLPYCLLAGSLSPEQTQRIERLVNCTRAQLVGWLKTIQKAEGEINVPLAYHDGAIGHCIRITAYDEASDRFVFHDPWPQESLLTRESNAAGIDAQRAGTLWSVTAQELERIVFAAFFFALQWARVQGVKFDLDFEAWKAGEFFEFFRLTQLDEFMEEGLVRRVFAPGNFKQTIALIVDTRETGKIRHASLRLHRRWMIDNFMLAIDLAKSFIQCFAPAPDKEQYAEIADLLWSLRDRRVLAQMKDADPDESDAIACVHAFIGKSDEAANVSTDFGHLSTGSAMQDENLVQFIDIDLR